METRVTLIIASILLGSGCLGLLIVRMTNPFFKGLGWLGGCFATGAMGAAIFATQVDMTPDIATLTADTLILLAYVFLHICILEVTESPTRTPVVGLSLVAIQAALYPIFHSLHRVREFSVVTLGVLVAVQTLQSAALLKKSARPGILPPIWFSTVLLAAFAGFNLFRSAAILVLGTPRDPMAPNPLQVPSAIIYLGVALGIGFGMFWITSAEIRLKLEQLANTDPLTGLHNRRSFLADCEKQLLASSRSGEPFSLILIDLDHFKKINDRHGHSAGDDVLCAVVNKLRNGVRNIDVLGRWGGEEFAALLPGADPKAALIVAQRLRNSVESLRVSSTRGKIISDPTPITISLGVATCLGPPDNIADLFLRCDSALYQAKAEGRNRVILTYA